MKKFIQQISPKRIVLAGIAVLCVLVFGLIALLEGLVKDKLYDQQMARRWSKQKDVAQISCFFSEKEAVEPTFYMGIRESVNKALQEASIGSENEKARLWIDAISQPGKISIANGSKSVELAAVGVTGDFFQFHPLYMETGSYFGPDSMMQDGIIIDEETAWQLFGSNDVVGMEVMIGQVPHIIMGVTRKETGRIAEAAGLDKSVCYLSLESLKQYGTLTGGYCYEAVLPNPVKGFALFTITTAVGADKKEIEVVENSSRYELLPIWQVIQSFGLRSMSKQGIVYPYWENIARSYEDIFALTLLVKGLLLVFPCIQGTIAVVCLWKSVRGKVKVSCGRLSDYLYDYEVRYPNRRKKQLGLAGAAAVLIVLIAVFSGQDKEKVAVSNHPIDASVIYREEDFPLAGGADNITQFVFVEDTLYTDEFSYGSSGMAVEEDEAGETQEGAEETDGKVKTEETGGFARIITAYDLEGNQKNQIRITLPENSGPGSFTADSKGNIYSIHTLYAYGEEGGDGGDSGDREKIYLQGHASTGEELFSVWLNENQAEDSYYYINRMYCADDSRLIMESSTGIEIYDLQGKQLDKMAWEDGEENRLLKIRDEKFVLITGSGGKFYSQSLDLDTGEKGEKLALPFNYYFYNAFPGKYYDIYLSNEKGVYGFNLGDEEVTPVMDFLASDFSSYGFNQLEIIDESTLMASYYGEQGGGLALFKKVPQGEYVEKVELTLGCYYLDSDVKKQVVKFNKESTSYRIKLIDYSEYNTEEDYTIGLNRLNSDIASGNVPDIILLQDGMPIDSYMAKGVFADYYELMEADPEFNKEDYLANIFEAYELDGKLYQMTPVFSITTFVGKTAQVGEDYSWSMDEALALRDSLPEGTKLFADIPQVEFLRQCLYNCGDEYVDWETGECYFNTDKFLQILDYAKTLPKEYVYVDYQDSTAYQEMEMQYREGRTILYQGLLTSFNDYGYWKHAVFGEDITMVGFPTDTENGSSFGYQFNLAISAQSGKQQAAWEFVKSFLSEEYQDGLEYYFPIRISSLEKMEKKAWEKPYYIDQEGNKVEYENTYWIGNMEIPASPLTKEETGKVMDFIKSVNRSSSYNENIFNIVMEEAAVFFEGEKSAREVADIMQSRVKIYINENR